MLTDPANIAKTTSFTYSSKLLVDPSEQLDVMVQDIMTNSVARNAVHGVTGTLHVNPVTFEVVHEIRGPLTAVSRLHENLIRDPRHTIQSKGKYRSIVNEGVPAQVMQLNLCSGFTAAGEQPSPRQVCRLIYASRMCAGGSVLAEQIASIFSAALKNNPDRRIGGTLWTNCSCTDVHKPSPYACSLLHYSHFPCGSFSVWRVHNFT